MSGFPKEAVLILDSKSVLSEIVSSFLNGVGLNYNSQ